MILFHTVLAIAIVAGLFDGIDREVTRRVDTGNRDDLIRRGYIL